MMRLPRSIALLSLATLLATADGLTVTLTRPSGVYKVGEPITFTVAAPGASKVSYILRRDGRTQLVSSDLSLGGVSTLLETRLEQPGQLLVEARLPGQSDPTLSGVMVAPDRIRPVTSCPDDFDSFWTAQIDGLRGLAANATSEAATSDDPEVALSAITLDHVDGAKVRGYVAKPTSGGPFPAIVLFEPAGVRALNRKQVVARAKQGWLVVNILAHDLPIDQNEAFYSRQANLKGYPEQGLGKRDQTYLRRILLAGLRALDHITEHPDWNRKTLVAYGAGQGGLQALAAGALHTQVTAVLAHTPAGCDHPAPAMGRAPTWPNWWNISRGDPTIMAECRYFDGVNFAARIKVPVLISAGLIDTTCPPTGIVAAANAITVPRELLLMPQADNLGRNGSHKPWLTRSTAWLKALAAGNEAPLPQPQAQPAQP
jgi:cephalosporin-C deacetylase-like acetyl esterase